MSGLTDFRKLLVASGILISILFLNQCGHKNNHGDKGPPLGADQLDERIPSDWQPGQDYVNSAFQIKDL